MGMRIENGDEAFLGLVGDVLPREIGRWYGLGGFYGYSLRWEVPKTGDIILLLAWIHACQRSRACHQLRCGEDRTRLGNASLKKERAHSDEKSFLRHLACAVAALNVCFSTTTLFLPTCHWRALAVTALVRTLVPEHLALEGYLVLGLKHDQDDFSA